MSTDKISERRAKQCDSRCNIPACQTEGVLGAAYNDRKRIIEVLAAWVKGFGFVAVCITVSRDVISNCIHIMLTGIADQAIHKYACDTD